MTSYGPESEVEVPRPIQLHQWNALTFLHWRYPPATVQALLPPDLTVETFDGEAWVGLVPFLMDVRAPGVPSVPYISRFPETNVRTYVTDPSGRRGIWFFSLDAARLAAVITARTTYALPYFWSRMRVEQGGGDLRYDSVRRWPGPAGARCRVTVRPGAAYTPQELGDRDHWLTARWRLFSTGLRGRLSYAEAHHPPWPLHRAEVLSLDETLMAAAGLPAPVGDPLAHFSPGVAVRIGLPRAATRSVPGQGERSVGHRPR